MDDYSVALHKSNWPTIQALQQCIDHHGWPIKVGQEGHPQWNNPLAAVPRTLGIPVVLKGEPLALEASFNTLDSDGAIDVNEMLASIGATAVHFYESDRILRLTFRVTIKEYQAGFYVLAALIKCFDGYGFHGSSHGTAVFADSLIAEAIRLDLEGATPVSESDINFMKERFIELGNMWKNKLQK